jgi:hypothetical protein
MKNDKLKIIRELSYTSLSLNKMSGIMISNELIDILNQIMEDIEKDTKTYENPSTAEMLTVLTSQV